MSDQRMDKSHPSINDNVVSHDTGATCSITGCPSLQQGHAGRRPLMPKARYQGLPSGQEANEVYHGLAKRLVVRILRGEQPDQSRLV
jgi:hypothetical protein